MADFFTGLAKRTLGLKPNVKPLIASTLVPGSAIRSKPALDEAWATRSPDTVEPSNKLEETRESQPSAPPSGSSGKGSIFHGPHPSISDVPPTSVESDVSVQRPVERAQERPPRASPEIAPLALDSFSATSEGIQPPIQQISNEFSQENFQDAQFGNRQRSVSSAEAGRISSQGSNSGLPPDTLEQTGSPPSASPAQIGNGPSVVDDARPQLGTSELAESSPVSSSEEAGMSSYQGSEARLRPNASEGMESTRAASSADADTIQQQKTGPLAPQVSLKPAISPLDISPLHAKTVQLQSGVPQSSAVTQSNPESVAPLRHLPLVPFSSSASTRATLPGLSAHHSGRVEPTLESITPAFPTNITEPWQSQSSYVPGSLGAGIEPWHPSPAPQSQSNLRLSTTLEPPAASWVPDVSRPSPDSGDAAATITSESETSASVDAVSSIQGAVASSHPMSPADFDASVVIPQDFSEAMTLPLVRSHEWQARQRRSPLESDAISTEPGLNPLEQRSDQGEPTVQEQRGLPSTSQTRPTSIPLSLTAQEAQELPSASETTSISMDSQKTLMHHPRAPEARIIQRRVTGNQPSLPSAPKQAESRVNAQLRTRPKSEGLNALTLPLLRSQVLPATLPEPQPLPEPILDHGQTVPARVNPALSTLMTGRVRNDRSGVTVATARSVASRQYLTADRETTVVMGGVEPRMTSVSGTPGAGNSQLSGFDRDHLSDKPGRRSEPTPTVEVRIGRVDVRRVNPPVGPPLSEEPVQEDPPLSLSDYLQKRDGGTL